tara:strand:- start:2024 stop:2371 length:348 start_codon:yes stop_codon:yes gene_type:complete
MYNLYLFLFIILTIIFEISAQYLFKLKYTKKNLPFYLVPTGIVLYAISGYFAYKLLKYGELGVINIIWHLFHFTALFFVGYFFLNEKLSKKKILASILGIISLFIFMTDEHFHHH